jgi:hypothetical protein
VTRFAIFAVLTLAGLASVQACPDETKKIKITLVVILASEDEGTIDPRLKTIAAEVQKLNPKLKSFCLKTMQSKSVKPNEKVLWPLVEEKEAVMTVKQVADGENLIRLTVTAPSMGEIEYQTVCGKFLPIVTRFHTKDRARLILAIRVQPCRGD